VSRRCHDSEWEQLDRVGARGRQLSLLREQLTRCAAVNPFYQRRWREAGLDVEKVTSLEEFARRVPLSTKQEFLADQSATPPYGDRLGVDPADLVALNITSGTTGIGQEAYGLSASDLHVAGDSMAHCLTWSGLRPGDVLVTTTPITFLAAGLAVAEAARQARVVPIYGFGLDKKLLVDLIVRYRAAAIFAVPNLLIQLQQAAVEAGYGPGDFASVRAIISPMIMPPFSRVHEIEQFWGARVYDVYGCTQSAGAVAASCEQSVHDGTGRRNPTHFVGKHFFCEVIDETGQQVGPGENGELVITTLRRQASPVIRFAMRDRVTYLPHDACGCGRPFDGFLPGETGRFDDMVKVKGINVWPPTVDNLIFGHPEIDEYRARVVLDERGREELLITVAYKPDRAPAGAADEALSRAIAEEIKSTTLIRPRVSTVDRLDHFDFKPRRWTDDRAAGLQKITW